MGIFDRFRNTSVVEPDSDEKQSLMKEGQSITSLRVCRLYWRI